MINDRGAGARRRRRRDKRLLILLIAGIVLLGVIIGVVLGLTRRSAPDPTAAENVTAPVDEEPVIVVEPEEDVPMLQLDTPEPTEAPTPQPAGDDYSGNVVFQPEASEGFLPVFRSSATEEKIIAITIDECDSPETLSAILDCAMQNKATLTLFPTGEAALSAEIGPLLKGAWENGFELENHTLTNSTLYRCSDEELATEIYQQNLALSQALGVNYSCHFLRPKGGNAYRDQRIHAYMRQMDYKGMALWSYEGSRNDIEVTKANLKPGLIYMYHCTDKDLAKLLEFIPYVINQGYKLVTLNQMFGYPANETSDLSGASVETPPLEAYQAVPVTYKKTTYAYGAMLLQRKLIALGFLSGEADGVYGADSAAAVKALQEASGLEATGEADPETQAKIDELYALRFPEGEA